LALSLVAVVAGAAIIVMGLHFLGLFRIALLDREARIEARNTRPGPVGSYVMGLAFAFGWTPCIGPVLAAILALAGAETTVARRRWRAAPGCWPPIRSAWASRSWLRVCSRRRSCG
jgi:cytochrome c biogenesis protein CcdA